MSNSGFKFVVPLIMSYGDHLGELVASSLDQTVGEVLVISSAFGSDVFYFQDLSESVAPKISDLESFLYWLKEQIGFSDQHFTFRFKSMLDKELTSYFSAIVYSVYFLSKSEKKPDFSSLAQSSLNYLNSAKLRIKPLIYFTQLLGGTRFYFGSDLLPVRQSFPKGYSIVVLKESLNLEHIETNIDFPKEGQKLLALYHGLFFSDWKYIKRGLMSAYLPIFGGEFDKFLTSFEFSYLRDYMGNHCFVFQNSLHSSDFIDYLKKSEVVNLEIKDFILSDFIEEGIRLC